MPCEYHNIVISNHAPTSLAISFPNDGSPSKSGVSNSIYLGAAGGRVWAASGFHKKSLVKKIPIFWNVIINSSLTWMGSSEHELSWTWMKLSHSIQVLWINLLKRFVQRTIKNTKQSAFCHWYKYTAYCIYVLIFIVIYHCFSFIHCYLQLFGSHVFTFSANQWH